MFFLHIYDFIIIKLPSLGALDTGRLYITHRAQVLLSYLKEEHQRSFTHELHSMNLKHPHYPRLFLDQRYQGVIVLLLLGDIKDSEALKELFSIFYEIYK